MASGNTPTKEDQQVTLETIHSDLKKVHDDLRKLLYLVTEYRGTLRYIATVLTVAAIIQLFQ